MGLQKYWQVESVRFEVPNAIHAYNETKSIYRRTGHGAKACGTTHDCGATDKLFQLMCIAFIYFFINLQI